MENQAPKGQYVMPEQPQPVSYPIDLTRCQSLEELAFILNALGLGMEEEFAKANNLEHLLVK